MEVYQEIMQLTAQLIDLKLRIVRGNGVILNTHHCLECVDPIIALRDEAQELIGLLNQKIARGDKS